MALSCCAGAALVSLGSLLLLLSTTATLLPIIAAAAADPAVRNTGRKEGRETTRSITETELSKDL